MAVLPEYERLHHQAEDLEHRVRDSMDRPNDHDAESLERNIIGLREDLEIGRKPRDLENRMKQIQAPLDHARHTDGSFMSISDAERYWKIFEDMRLSLRNFPNY